LINDSVDAFLTELGYDHNAVPFDYIEGNEGTRKVWLVLLTINHSPTGQLGGC